MSGEFKPGDVASILDGRIALRVEYNIFDCAAPHGDGGHWHTADQWYADGPGINPRRLLVIDAAGLTWLPNRLRHDADRMGGQTAKAMRELADQIEGQQRSPKPDEPTGLGAVVVDDKGDRHFRHNTIPGAPWRLETPEPVSCESYAEINAVEVLNPGVPS